MNTDITINISISSNIKEKKLIAKYSAIAEQKEILNGEREYLQPIDLLDVFEDLDQALEIKLRGLGDKFGC